MTNDEAIAELEERYMSMSMCATTDECKRANEALDLAIAALERDRWISVEERLPEKRHCVLIFTKKSGTAEGEYDGDGWTQYRWSAKMGIDVVTHWMPLPEPPKEET